MRTPDECLAMAAELELEALSAGTDERQRYSGLARHWRRLAAHYEAAGQHDPDLIGSRRVPAEMRSVRLRLN